MNTQTPQTLDKSGENRNKVRSRPVVVVNCPSPVSRLDTPPTSSAPKTTKNQDDLLPLLHPALSHDPVRKQAHSSSKESLLLPCPNCYKTVLTEVRPVEWSVWTCLRCCSYKGDEVEHVCPNCKILIATYYQQ